MNGRKIYIEQNVSKMERIHMQTDCFTIRNFIYSGDVVSRSMSENIFVVKKTPPNTDSHTHTH